MHRVTKRGSLEEANTKPCRHVYVMRESACVLWRVSQCSVYACILENGLM